MPTDHPMDTVGHLTITDELGSTHRVTIRREDLTTTNDGYRAIRDAITDTLAAVFELNRSTPLEDRVRAMPAGELYVDGELYATCDGCESSWPAYTLDEEREHEPDCKDPASGSAETVPVA